MPDPLFTFLIKLGLAVLVGGLIGLEREFQDKAAGLRTLIFICVGAMLFTTFAFAISPGGDGTRIAANIVSGVGFLGAGVILREGGRVVGLTTASTVWLTAAMGMGIGGGQYLLALAATPIVLIVLWLFPRVENLIDNINIVQMYEITCPISLDKVAELEAAFSQHGLHAGHRHVTKSSGDMICRWKVSGPPLGHQQMSQHILSDVGIREFRT